MAFDAPIVEDWGHIFSEGNFCLGGPAREDAHGEERANDERECAIPEQAISSHEFLPIAQQP